MDYELESLIVNICSNMYIGTKHFIRTMKKTNIRKNICSSFQELLF